MLIALAFGASASVYAQPIPSSFEFECRFEIPSLGKEPGVTCHAEGVVCANVIGTTDRTKCGEILSEGRNNSELKVHCTDGFKLFDRYTQFTSERDDFTIFGNDDGNRSFLTIFDIEGVFPTDHDRRHKFEAELVNVHDDGGAHKLEGACKVEFIRNLVPVPPAPPAAPAPAPANP
ncbi:MAG: hypothetical protein A2X94_04815 [Bdellovibrionales bacterium GWB1_55_8]|nr:MAG: hypothetical protein A2X94_04815 [Bdellovibrionales bacterium GWB1_55_8]